MIFQFLPVHFFSVCIISVFNPFFLKVEVVVKKIIMVVSLGKMSHYYGMCQRASNSFHKCHLQNKCYKSNVAK